MTLENSGSKTGEQRTSATDDVISARLTWGLEGLIQATSKDANVGPCLTRIKQVVFSKYHYNGFDFVTCLITNEMEMVG